VRNARAGKRGCCRAARLGRLPVHVLNGSGRLTPYLDQIAHTAERCVIECASSLVIADDSVDLVIRDALGRTIPELGVGGFNPDAHTVFVALDPGHPAFERAVDKELARTIAHEIHHLARRRGPGYGGTLLAALVSEGLADHFAMEHTKLGPPPWAEALTKSELERIEQMATGSYHSAEYDHRAWFFGSTVEALPRWAGYALGYRLVGEYLSRNRNTSLASLVTASAESFLAS
jgi:hypothetical protein